MRWALTTRASWATPNRSSTATAACIVGQSLADPITTPTSGSAIGHSPLVRWRDGGDAQDDPLALDRRLVVVAEVALRQRVDVAAGLVAADLADDAAADLGVAVRVLGVPDVTVTSGCCWIAWYLARWTSVLISTWSSLASTHMTWLQDWPLGSWTAIVAKFLPVLARSRMAGSSIGPG